MEAGWKSALCDPMTGPICSPLYVAQVPNRFNAVSLALGAASQMKKPRSS